MTRADADGGEPLLAVDGLCVQFDVDDGPVRAVDGVSLSVEAGETVCVVGESGGGKTVLAESLTRLVGRPGEVVAGDVRFRGESVLDMDDASLRALRGGEIAHVFQDAPRSLNPVYTVGRQLVEAARLHESVSRTVARNRAIDLLDRVGIPDPASRFDAYPHELSGGMCQRVAIALALAADPALLVADEPTTGLDVTMQAAILRLLDDLSTDLGLAVLLVTHDLRVVAQVADRVVVLYAGKVMERGDAVDLFDDPSHPYTRALLAARPERGRPPTPIEGSIRDSTGLTSGCRFRPRCPYAVEACAGGDQPPLFGLEGANSHDVSCVHYAPDGDPTTVLGSGRPDDGESDLRGDGPNDGGFGDG